MSRTAPRSGSDGIGKTVAPSIPATEAPPAGFAFGRIDAVVAAGDGAP